MLNSMLGPTCSPDAQAGQLDLVSCLIVPWRAIHCGTLPQSRLALPRVICVIAIFCGCRYGPAISAPVLVPSFVTVDPDLYGYAGCSCDASYTMISLTEPNGQLYPFASLTASCLPSSLCMLLVSDIICYIIHVYVYGCCKRIPICTYCGTSILASFVVTGELIVCCRAQNLACDWRISEICCNALDCKQSVIDEQVEVGCKGSRMGRLAAAAPGMAPLGVVPAHVPDCWEHDALAFLQQLINLMCASLKALLAHYSFQQSGRQALGTLVTEKRSAAGEVHLHDLFLAQSFLAM